MLSHTLTIIVTHINVVPTLALKLIRNPITARGDFSTVKCLMNAAAPLKQELSDQVSQRLGCVITQWYGMTEAKPQRDFSESNADPCFLTRSESSYLALR